jgi:hypothetical protein
VAFLIRAGMMLSAQLVDKPFRQFDSAFKAASSFGVFSGWSSIGVAFQRSRIK